MKRYLFVIFSFIALAGCYLSFFAPAVSAAEVSPSNDFINVLEYTTPNGGGTYSLTLTPDDNTVLFSLPFEFDLYYVEALYSVTSGSLPANVVISTTRQSASAEVLNYDGYGRAYYQGYIETTNFFYLTFDITSSITITFQQVYVSDIYLNDYYVAGTGELAYSTAVYSFQFDSRNTVPGSWAGVPNSGDGSINISYAFPDAHWYDYLSVLLLIHGVEIDSVFVQCGGGSATMYMVPYELDYINPNGTTSSSLLSMRMDLRSIPRDSLKEEFSIFITGRYNIGDIMQIGFLNGAFYYLSDQPDPMYFYFREFRRLLNGVSPSIESAADRIVSAIGGSLGSTGVGEQIKDQAAQSSGKLDAEIGKLDDNQPPDISIIQESMDFSGIISPDMIPNASSFLLAMFDTPLIYKVCMLGLIFALVATVLFGKR